jgi:integrase
VKPKCAHNTYVSYRVDVQCHILPHLGRYPLSQLEPRHVRTMLNALRQEGLAAKSVVNVRTTLRAALHQAERDGLVQRNVAALTDPPKYVRTEVQPLTPEDAARFLDAIRGDRLEALYTVALSLGLRRGEVLGLRWQDVDLDRRRLQVRVQIQRVDGKLQPVPLQDAKESADD